MLQKQSSFSESLRHQNEQKYIPKIPQLYGLEKSSEISRLKKFWPSFFRFVAKAAKSDSSYTTSIGKRNGVFWHATTSKDNPLNVAHQAVFASFFSFSLSLQECPWYVLLCAKCIIPRKSGARAAFACWWHFEDYLAKAPIIFGNSPGLKLDARESLFTL